MLNFVSKKSNNMKYFSTSLATLLAVMCCSDALAAPLTADQALSRAQQFARSHRVASSGGATLTLAYGSGLSANPAYYVFNRTDNAGYLIVSGDDRTVPLLGYCDTGHFDPDNVPDNMRWWLSQYDHEMAYLRSHPELSARQLQPVSRSVTPLLTCIWNQSAPYNNMCPTYTKDGETKRAVTGCVATAAAQIMYYHRWPEHGTGSKSYSYSVGGQAEQTLSADFSQSHYDWSHMLDDYDSQSDATSQAAVALLMRDVGYSVEMMYKDGSSGAYSKDIPNALIEYFGYDSGTHITYRQYFGIEGWEQLLRDELDARRPVYYSGSSGDGGHAFVVDGYNRDGYFHINWGWGGMSNGYYIISMLNPDEQGIGSFEGGYNNNQAAIVGIQPKQSSVDPYSFAAFYESFSPAASQVNLGESVSLSFSNAALLGSKNWDSLLWGNCILSEDERVVVQAPDLDCDASDIEPWYYYSASTELTPSTSLANGRYHVRLVYSCDDLPYKYFSSSSSAPSFILMEVRDGVAYFTTPDQSELSLVSLSSNSSTVYSDRQFEVTATVQNNGLEYYDNVHFALLRNGSQQVQSDPIGIDIAQGRQLTFGARMTAPTTTGQYTLALFDNNNQRIGNSITVTVADGGDAASLQYASALKAKSDVMPADHIEATVDITNTGGVFMGVLEMFVLPSDDLKIKSIIRSDIVTLQPGETQTVAFDGSFGGVIGKSYRLWLRDPNISDKYYLWNNEVAFTVGAYQADVLAGDVNADGTVDVTDVNLAVNMILGKAPIDLIADLNGDGTVDVTDVNAIVNIVLSKN